MAKKRVSRGAPLKPVEKAKVEKVTISFTEEHLDLFDRAAAKDDDNRANWIRRAALRVARAELGISQPDPGKEDPAAREREQKK